MGQKVAQIWTTQTDSQASRVKSDRLPAEKKIAAQAREQHSDLILMGTTGLSSLEGLQIGSTAEREAQSTLYRTRTP